MRLLCSSSQLYKSNSETCLFPAVSCCNMWNDSFPGRAIWTSCSILNLPQYNFELDLYAIKSLFKTPVLKTAFNSLLLFKSSQGMAFPSNVFRLEFLYLKKFMNSYLLLHHYDADALQGSCLGLVLFKIRFALHAIAYYITWIYHSFFPWWCQLILQILISLKEFA